jgi:hypothetical protein
MSYAWRPSMKNSNNTTRHYRHTGHIRCRQRESPVIITQTHAAHSTRERSDSTTSELYRDGERHFRYPQNKKSSPSFHSPKSLIVVIVMNNALHVFVGLHESLELDAIQNATTQSPRYKSFELPNILAKEFRRFMIEWIVRIGLVKEINQSIND